MMFFFAKKQFASPVRRSFFVLTTSGQYQCLLSSAERHVRVKIVHFLLLLFPKQKNISIKTFGQCTQNKIIVVVRLHYESLNV